MKFEDLKELGTEAAVKVYTSLFEISYVATNIYFHLAIASLQPKWICNYLFFGFIFVGFGGQL